jgi:adenine phosphoribosyltransferase
MNTKELKSLIRNVPDFPVKGIVFRDITTLIKDGKAFKYVVNSLCDRYRGMLVDHVVGIESRGFIFGAALAHKLGCGFIPARKLGKLPAPTIEESYELEYGRTSLQMHTDAIALGERIVIVDDLLATGGTLRAAANLVERLGGIVVEIAVVVELKFLKGREKIRNYRFYSMLEYHKE